MSVNYLMEAKGMDREEAEIVDYLMCSKGMSYEEALETSLMLLQIQNGNQTPLEPVLPCHPFRADFA